MNQTEKEKQELKFRLTKIIITPQMMLLKNYNYYYEFGEKEYAKKVGQLTMQVDWMKKKSEELLGPNYESKFSQKPFED